MRMLQINASIETRASILRAWPAILLFGCTTLPTNETAALKTMAEADQTAFAGLASTEFDVVKARHLAKVAAGEERLTLDSACFVSKPPADLTKPPDLCVTKAGGESLVSNTRQVQKLATGIGAYAGAMSDLASATDLEAANTAAAKVATSLRALGAAAGPSGAAVGGVADILVIANRELQVSARRHLMFRCATTAQPIIEEAAAKLQSETAALRLVLVTARQQRLTTLMQQYSADKGTLDAAARADLVQQIVQAASDLADAQAIQIDFSPLIKAHQAVLTALKNPKFDVNQSVQQAQAFLTALQSFSSATAPTVPEIPAPPPATIPSPPTP